ncbi:conserved Plasmodium protein, unknown function [Plasmodium relictum]|uniref:Uncharacterized protein n=1 Tax=Plasmodium relictum TaxID=85471 RepID=A0A1J1H5X8_PLARL|nr:conserved Plasmodium protein, unknown function [Plasmodium relictum]CRG98836.1 conserved Plasmodium protein, unknown function [Plasmodium relictum]
MNTRNSINKVEYSDTYISSYVEWINNIFNTDTLINVNLLNIENRKRKLNETENIEKKNKTLNEENSYNNILIEEADYKDNNNHLEKFNFNKIYKSTNFNIDGLNDNKLNLNENYFINKFNLNDPIKKNSSSCDISEIESEEPYEETIKKNENTNNLNLLRNNIQNLSDGYDNLNQVTKKKLNTDIIINENSNEIHKRRFNSIGDEISKFLIYSSDNDDINNTNVEKIKTNDSLCASYNYDKIKKNIHTLEEVDKEFYIISKKEEKKEQGRKEKTGKIMNNNSNIESDNINNNYNNGMNINMNYSINSNNTSNNNTNNNNVNKNFDNNITNNAINLKKDEKVVKQENLSSNKNLVNNFCFWNIENESYISRPLYVQNINKKYFTLLEESEEMIKNYSSNQYSIKFVPRHLLYVLSQVASRIFFDPMYRKQLFFQF